MLAKNILFTITCCLLLSFTVSDIPSHCLSSQIMGDWIFYHTEAVPKTLKDLYNHKCGIRDHTDKHTIRDIHMDLNTFTKSFEVKFNKDHTVETVKNSSGFNIDKTGWWTMVYDEAIEFGMGKKNTSDYSNFLVFMQYSKNDGKTLPEVKTKFYSHCYHAFIGWFHTQGNKWGCMWGHKKIADWKNPTNGEAPAKQRVLEKSIVKESFLEKGESYETNFLQVNSKVKNTNKSLLKLNSSFKDHAEIARRINSLNLGWTAKVYENFQDKTIGEMNNMYGKYNSNNKIQGEFRFKSKESNLFFSSEDEITNSQKAKEDEEFYNNFYFKRFNENEMKRKKLRKTVDFRQFMGKPKSQGSCGSCYAQAATTMLEARLRRKYSNIIKKYKDPKVNIKLIK